MLIGRITGEVVSTAKHESHSDLKLLLVEPLDLDDQPAGVPYVAVDVLDAGVGDRVLLATDGWAAMSAVSRLQSPIDAAIVGVIDRVDLDA